MNYTPSFVKTTDIKCRCCKKKLFENKTAEGIVEMKCPRCKEIITIKLEGKNAKR